MPRKIVVQIACDHCGAETDDKPQTIAFNGREAELDLCEDDRAALREAIESWLAIGHKPSKEKVAKEKGKSNSTDAEIPCDVPDCTFKGKSEPGVKLHKIRKHGIAPAGEESTDTGSTPPKRRRRTVAA